MPKSDSVEMADDIMPNEKEISGRKVLDRLNRNAGRCALLPLAPPGVPGAAGCLPAHTGARVPRGQLSVQQCVPRAQPVLCPKAGAQQYWVKDEFRLALLGRLLGCTELGFNR